MSRVSSLIRPLISPLTISFTNVATSTYTPLPSAANLQDLNDTTTYAVVSSGAAWGDSITANLQSATMLASGAAYSDYTVLNYAPSGADNVISHGPWPQEIAGLVGSFTNEGLGGQTSSEILTRMQSGSPADVDVVSFGTNDSVNSVAKQQTLYDNIDAVAAAGFPVGTTVFMPYKGGGDQSASSYGAMAYARAQGFQWFDWNTALLKSAHQMESDSPDIPVAWLEGRTTNAFMSSPNPTGALDTTHPGSAFSRAVSTELAAMVGAVGGADSPPYMRMQNMAVDWDVSEGTVIGTLDTIGTVSNTAVNNALNNGNLITLNGTQVLRGSAAAPSASWVDLFIEVQNAHGSFLQRLSLGRSTGGTLFGLSYPVLEHYLTGYAANSGTISISGNHLTSATSRFIKVGAIEIQCRTNGDFWFKNITSSVLIFGGNVGDDQHVMITWDATHLYSVIGTSYTDRTAIRNAGDITTNGDLRLFGATSGTPSLALDGTFRTDHIYISDQYHGPGSDLSPIWDGTASAITGTGSVLLGDTPAYSCAGGPGRFATTNWGDAGAPGYYPHWDASNAIIR